MPWSYAANRLTFGLGLRRATEAFLRRLGREVGREAKRQTRGFPDQFREQFPAAGGKNLRTSFSASSGTPLAVGPE